MKSLVVESERAILALGEVQLRVQKSEEKSKAFKRSIYIVKDINKGDKFTSENLRTIRPGDGLEPKYLEMVIGGTAKENLKRGTPMKLKYLI